MTWDPNGYRKYVSDDGTFVILKLSYYRDDMPTMRVLTQKTDKSFDADDLMDSFDYGFDNSYEVVQASFLEVLSPSPKLFGMWHARSARWVVLDLEKMTLEK